MDLLVERCAGVDIGKAEVVACVRTPSPTGKSRRKQTRTFSSFNSDLAAMADWVRERDPSRPLHYEHDLTATLGGGAFLDGKPIRVSDCTSLDRALVGTGFGYDPDRRGGQAEGVQQLIAKVRDIRRIGGGAIDLCYVGCGRLDAADAMIRRVLDEAEDPISRARVLAAYVEIVLVADDVAAEVNRRTLRAVRRLKMAKSPQGFNIGINRGRCAGDGRPGQVSQHGGPRWGGETNVSRRESWTVTLVGWDVPPVMVTVVTPSTNHPLPTTSTVVPPPVPPRDGDSPWIATDWARAVAAVASTKAATVTQRKNAPNGRMRVICPGSHAPRPTAGRRRRW